VCHKCRFTVRKGCKSLLYLMSPSLNKVCQHAWLPILTLTMHILLTFHILSSDTTSGPEVWLIRRHENFVLNVKMAVVCHVVTLKTITSVIHSLNLNHK
jgi:hypothetical protein